MTAPSLTASSPAVDNEVRRLFRHVKPMKFDDLLDKYLPGLNDALPPIFDITPDDFKKVNDAKSETTMYAPLRDVLDKVLAAMGGEEKPLLGFQVTNNMAQRHEVLADEPPIFAPDVSAYRPSILQDPKSISWRTIDLAIEVKLNLSDDPVTQLDSDESHDQNYVQSLNCDGSMSQVPPVRPRGCTLARMADYARYMTCANARTRVFILGIYAKNARIFVYDRAATVFSEPFDYNQRPELLGRFLYRFSQADDAARGFDPTVTEYLSPAERIKVLQANKTWDALRNSAQSKHKVDIPAIRGTPCRITVPKDGKEPLYLTLGGPIFSSSGLFSRGTRCWLAFDAEGNLKPDASNTVLIKDSWLEAGRIPERDYYEQIQRSGKQDGIAQFIHSAEFDVNAHSTMNHKAAGVVAHHHVRSVLGTIGRRLSQFKSTKELTQGILSAVKGALIVSRRGGFCATHHHFTCHQNAFKNGVLHRDISERNVLLPLIPGQGSGIIIDFDLSLFTDSEKRRHVEGWGLTMERYSSWQLSAS